MLTIHINKSLYECLTGNDRLSLSTVWQSRIAAYESAHRQEKWKGLVENTYNT